MPISVTKTTFGKTAQGEEVSEYLLTAPDGSSVTVLDYGCTLRTMNVPDRDGKIQNVILGYGTIEEYEQNGGFLGATVGRCANRIAGGKFELNGKTYSLYCNDGENHLHGGKIGFDKKIWEAEVQDGAVVFQRTSPDGEEGYPGTLRTSVTFSWTEDHKLTIAYRAETDQDTVVNLTNHAYFLLGGKDVLGHQLKLNASHFTPAGPGLIPTGEVLPVEGTPFDFTAGKEIGRDISQPDPRLTAAGGYDHNFALDGSGDREIATLRCPESGITLTVSTDLPGVQVYTANSFTGEPFPQYGAVCLETQFFPNAVNIPAFASPVLKAGETFSSKTVYAFSVK